MDELVRIRRILSPAQMYLTDRAIGYLVVHLRAIHQLERTATEEETLRQLELLRRRLRADD